ncbi:uncharacterized protein [Oncorhynchus clarkii lewisi]|uniref:uncharacterized protein isoform X5 n=1 Tax=Oncorhynchus clarkii lewisi TaxID=490388 RepID=UPI0039B8E414
MMEMSSPVFPWRKSSSVLSSFLLPFPPSISLLSPFSSLQDEPFSSHIPETLFNISRYFLHNLTKDVPLGITKVNTLYALAKQSRTPGEFELARPSRFQETMDLGSLTVCSKPLQPGPDLHVLSLLHQQPPAGQPGQCVYQLQTALDLHGIVIRSYLCRSSTWTRVLVMRRLCLSLPRRSLASTGMPQ